MQPVTIKSKQYSHTLWLAQLGLCLLLVMTVGLAVFIHVWLLLLWPFIVWGLIHNHRTISKQTQLHYNMRSNGQLVVMHKLRVADQEKNHILHQDKMQVEVLAFWYLPHILLLKLSVNQFKTPVHLTVFRSVLGANDFSHLLAGITQMNSSLQSNHELKK